MLEKRPGWCVGRWSVSHWSAERTPLILLRSQNLANLKAWMKLLFVLFGTEVDGAGDNGACGSTEASDCNCRKFDSSEDLVSNGDSASGGDKEDDLERLSASGAWSDSGAQSAWGARSVAGAWSDPGAGPNCSLPELHSSSDSLFSDKLMRASGPSASLQKKL